MLNKIFGKKSNNSNNQGNKKLFGGLGKLSKKVVDTLKIAPVAIAGILAGCSSTSDNNQVDIEQNLDNTNGGYTLQSEGNKKINLDKIATKSDILDALGPVIVKDEFGNSISDNTEIEEETITYKEIHITKKGEWFHSIARYYGIDVYELIALNKDDLEDIDNIPVGYKVKLGNLVKESNDSQSFNIDTSVESTYTQTDRQVNVVNASIESEPVEIDEKKQINIESDNVSITKTYEVSEDENLYSIARKTGISYKLLKEYNQHLRKYDEKKGIFTHVVYPTKYIFLEKPNLDSQMDIDIIADHDNYVADINNYKQWKNKYKDEWNQKYGEDLHTSVGTTIVNNNDLDIENSTYKQHKVISGDNLTFIAGKYNITVNDIAELNELDKNKFLQLGAVLKIPKPNKNLVSYSKLNEEEFKKQFFNDLRNYIVNIPNFLYQLDFYINGEFNGEYLDSMYEINSNDFDYLIQQLYNLPEKQRNNFINSNIHPDTLNSQSAYKDLNNRNPQTQCGAAMRDILRIVHNDVSVNSSGMNADKYVPYFENSQDYVAARINSIYDIKPGASLIYDPGYGIGDRYDVGHVEYYVGEHEGQQKFAHITSDKYGKTYPYPGGSLNSYVQEAGLRNIVYYHKSLFDSNYVNTNMTKTEYLAYQETQRQERIANVQAKSQLVNNKKIINNKVTSLRLKGKELTLPLNYVTRFIESDQSEDSKEYLLSKVSKDCLQGVFNQCYDILVLQKKAKRSNTDPDVQKYTEMIRVADNLLTEAKNMSNQGSTDSGSSNYTTED